MLYHLLRGTLPAVAASSLSAVGRTSRRSLLPPNAGSAGLLLFAQAMCARVGSGSGGRVGGPNVRPAPEIPYSVKGLRHIAIAVPDVVVAGEHYRRAFGAQVSDPKPIPDHGVTTVFVILGNFHIELLQPLGDNSPISKFLEKHPKGGLHHLCFAVDDLNSAVTHLSALGISSLGDGEPKIGAEGDPVLFLHPKDNMGVLTELQQVDPK